MEGYKLLNRMEDVTWKPPKLTFTIGRHGGTVMGSSRVELQHWEIDRANREAIFGKTGHRQQRPTAKRVYIRPLVARILAAIHEGSESQLVLRHEDGRVSLNTTRIFPKGSAVKMTLEGWRKRLREAVARVLLKEGMGALGERRFPTANGMSRSGGGHAGRTRAGTTAPETPHPRCPRS
jgi:hypothetical protein